MNMIFGFDIDDVIFQTFAALQRVAMERYNEKLDPPASFVDDFKGQLTPSDWREVIDIALIEYDKLIPMDGAIDFLHRYYYNTKNEIIFITSRNPTRRPEIKNATEKLFEKWIPDLPHQIFYSKSGTNPKVKIVHDQCVDVFVEDRLKYVKEIAKSGIPVLMPLKPWNMRMFDEKPQLGIFPVITWDDIDMFFNLQLNNKKRGVV